VQQLWCKQQHHAAAAEQQAATHASRLKLRDDQQRHLAAAARALSANLCLATSEGLAMSAQAFATTSGGRSSATDALLLAAQQTRGTSVDIVPCSCLEKAPLLGMEGVV